MPTPREDINELLGILVPLAQQMVEEHGEFHPFGAMTATDGRPQLAGATPGTELPEAPELIAKLTRTFQTRAAAGEIRACALCTNVRIEEDGGHEAIRVAVEHRAHEPVLFVVPYRRRRLRGYRFEDLSAGPGAAEVFTPPPAPAA